MDVIKLVALVFGASGFWKLVEVLINLGMNKRLKRAETKNLYAQANGQIIANWQGWSEKLETRVKELEAKVGELETLIGQLKRRNKLLESELQEIKKSQI